VSPIIRRVVSAYGHADRPRHARADARADAPCLCRTRDAAARRRGKAGARRLRHCNRYRERDVSLARHARDYRRVDSRIDWNDASAGTRPTFSSSFLCVPVTSEKARRGLFESLAGNRKGLHHRYGSLRFPFRYYRAPRMQLYRVHGRQTL